MYNTYTRQLCSSVATDSWCKYRICIGARALICRDLRNRVVDVGVRPARIRDRLRSTFNDTSGPNQTNQSKINGNFTCFSNRYRYDVSSIERPAIHYRSVHCILPNHIHKGDKKNIKLIVRPYNIKKWYLTITSGEIKLQAWVLAVLDPFNHLRSEVSMEISTWSHLGS